MLSAGQLPFSYMLRPVIFNNMVYGFDFLKNGSVGRNKNKNKISLHTLF